MAIERVIRVARLEDSERFDREDVAQTTAEERLAEVERLRREWFGDFTTERRLSRVLHALISTETRFLLIGGHAVAVHAEPRFTEDLDVFVQPTLDNARRVREALIQFGFGSIAPPPEELAQPNRVWMLGWRRLVRTGLLPVAPPG